MATTLIENLKISKSETFLILMVSKFKSIFMEISRYVILCYYKLIFDVIYDSLNEGAFFRSLIKNCFEK